MATYSSIPAWRIPMDRGAWRATVHGVAESDTTEQLTHTIRREGHERAPPRLVCCRGAELREGPPPLPAALSGDFVHRFIYIINSLSPGPDVLHYLEGKGNSER